MDCGTPGFFVHHQLPELAQTQVHRVGDAIQLSHPLLSLSPAFSLSQDQGLFQWVSIYNYMTYSFSYLEPVCYSMSHWKRLWCWEGLGAGGEGDDKGWDGWMASPTWWTRVCMNSGSWWWTGRPGVLQFMGSQRVGHDWVTELNVLI